MTLLALPYIAWNSVLQAIPESRELILIIGDVLCIIPQMAFQRGLGAVMEISTKYDDESLSWADVWEFETRVWFPILMMFFIGSLEWLLLASVSVTRMSRMQSVPRSHKPRISRSPRSSFRDFCKLQLTGDLVSACADFSSVERLV